MKLIEASGTKQDTVGLNLSVLTSWMRFEDWMFLCGYKLYIFFPASKVVNLSKIEGSRFL